MAMRTRNIASMPGRSYFVFSAVCFADRYFAAENKLAGLNRR